MFLQLIQMNRSWTNYIYTLLPALFWTGSFFWSKWSLEYMAPMGAASVRFMIASVSLLIMMLFVGRFNWQQIWEKKWPLLAVAFAGVFLFNFTFFKGMRATSPINASLIMALNPLTTLVLSYFALQTRITRQQIIGAIISFVGVTIVILKGDLHNLLLLQINAGDPWIMLTNIFFATNHVLVKKYLSDIHPITLTTVTAILGLIMMMFFAIPDLKAVNFPYLPTGFWGAIFCLGFLGTALAYIFWNIGLVRIGPSKAVIFINIVPFFVAIASLLLGEPITTAQLLGGLFVIFGIFWAQGKLKWQKKIMS